MVCVKKEFLLAMILYESYCVVLARDTCNKQMEFKITFEEKVLVNHTYKSLPAIDDMNCQTKCFLDDRCISYSFDTKKRLCNLSDSYHIMHPEHLVNKANAIYRSAENTCKCNVKNMTCRFNFVDGSHRCVCQPGFTGERCETKIDGCTGNPCQNNERCVDLVDTNSCKCAQEYWGKNCSFLRVWTSITNTPICIGTKKDMYGRILIPASFLLIRFKLIYTSGKGVSHRPSQKPGKWGSMGVFQIIITNVNKEQISPPKTYITKSSLLGYNLDGATTEDSELSFPEISPPLSVEEGSEFWVWFGQDLLNYREWNNRGETCANVMIESIIPSSP